MIIIVLIFPVFLAAKEKQDKMLKKTTIESYKYFDINRISCSIQNNAVFARHPIAGNSDLSLNGDYLIYTSGLWIAAKVNGEIRASAADFVTDFIGGAIDESGEAFGKNDSLFRVFKITTGDNSLNNVDYAEWPHQFGAPVQDNGEPQLLGDQTLWCSFTDGFIEDRNVYNICPPLLAEVHLTVFGFETLDNVMFLHYDIINKSETNWDSAYVGIYCDPDVGDANNDLICSDSTLKTVICYDGTDDNYIQNHAAGYQMIASPAVPSVGDTALTLRGDKPGYRNIPVYAPRIDKHNFPGWMGWGEMFHRGPETAKMIYYRLNCLDYYGEPAINPVTGHITKWTFSGDPVTGEGWLDDIPRDRRMMISAGPVDVTAGDTCSFTIAVIGVRQLNRLRNVVEVKQVARNLINVFKSGLKIVPDTDVSVKHHSDKERQVIVNVRFAEPISLNSVRAQIYDYQNTRVHEMELFDDGAHDDKNRNNLIFGNSWLTYAFDDAYYLNLVIQDQNNEEYTFEKMDQNIMLTNKIDMELIVAGDSENYNGQANPGEHIRLKVRVTNNYPFTIHNLYIASKIPEAFVDMYYQSDRLFFLDSISAGETKQLNGTIIFDIEEQVPENYKLPIYFESQDLDNHFWQHDMNLPIKPFDYIPNEIRAQQVAGTSDAYFVIRVIEPDELTGHTYTISVLDSAQAFWFNLFDETVGEYVLYANPLPDEHAYNVPITDGFKVVEGYAPEGSIKNVYYENVNPDHPVAFEGVPLYNSCFFDGGVAISHFASKEEIYAVEMEFVNEMDTSGVVGDPAGQLAYRYANGNPNAPTAVTQNPFRIWKIVQGERAGLFDVCFFETPNAPRSNGVWDPDASQLGGFERLFVMKTDYDPSGNYYLNKRLDMNNVMYQICLRLIADSSVVDENDKIVIGWERPPTAEDRFQFVPTDVQQKETGKPELDFKLRQNCPNPFNQNTKIEFSLEKREQVRFKIFNIMGQEVITLIEETLQPGNHKIEWTGKNKYDRDVVSSIYFGILKTRNRSQLIKMILIR